MSAPPSATNLQLAFQIAGRVIRMGWRAPTAGVWSAYLFTRRKFSLTEILNQNLCCGGFAFRDFRSMMSKEEAVVAQRQLTPAQTATLVEDKAAFAKYARDNALPIPNEVARIEANGKISSAFGEGFGADLLVGLLRPMNGKEIVLKNNWGHGGSGVTVARVSDNDIIAMDKSRITIRDYYQSITRSHGKKICLIQERLTTHDAIREISGSTALQTLRVITYVNRDKQVITPVWKLRLAGPTMAIDNFGDGRAGGALCRLNASGCIDQVLVHNRKRNRLCEAQRFGPRGESPLGFQVPYRDETITLVKKAANAFLPIPCIGWDVAITNSGPILIEGNITWDPLTWLEGPMRDLWDEIKAKCVTNE